MGGFRELLLNDAVLVPTDYWSLFRASREMKLLYDAVLVRRLPLRRLSLSLRLLPLLLVGSDFSTDPDESDLSRLGGMVFLGTPIKPDIYIRSDAWCGVHAMRGDSIKNHASKRKTEL